MSPPRATLRRQAKQRRAEAERAILDATETLLGDRELADLRVEDVMASTGLTRTAFYRFFPDLETVLLRRLAEIDVEFRQVQMWREDPRHTLGAAVTHLVTIFKDHGRLLLAFDSAAADTQLGEAWRGLVQGIIDGHARFITEMCRQGLSAVERPDQTASALIWMIDRYLLEIYGRGPAVPVEAAAATLTGIIQRTLFCLGHEEPSPDWP